MIESIITIMTRQLEQLKLEINSYQEESAIWTKSGEISNSAGNLCLHLSGNLQHFIGAVLGDSGYIRKRDDEFGLQDVPREDLLVEIDRTIEVVTSTLENLDPETLSKVYPREVFGQPITTEFFLIHLNSHLGYHLGQINYHRRLLAG